MTIPSYAKVTGAVVTLVAIVLTGMSVKAPPAHADEDDTDARVRIWLPDSARSPEPGRERPGYGGTR
jgi:hypothetical protein